MRSGHHVKTERCPSCGHSGLLGGAPIGRSPPILGEDSIYHEIRISPNLFECKCCELKIKGLDELMAAGFDHEFQSVADVDVVEHFGIDPMEYVDTDEIIHEYEAGKFYEYQDE